MKRGERKAGEMEESDSERWRERVDGREKGR